jgi:hypothetical protein
VSRYEKEKEKLMANQQQEAEAITTDTGPSFVSRPYVGNQRNPDEMQAELDRLTKEAGGEVEVEEETSEEDTSFVSKKKSSATPEDSDWETRYKNLQSFSNRKINELVTRESELKRQMDVARREEGITSVAGEMSDQELASVLEKNPQLFKFVETVANRKAKTVETHLDDERRENNKIRRELGEAKISQAHPEWNDIKGSPEFAEWLEDLPTTMTDPLYDPNNFDPSPAIRLVDFYKKATSVEKPKEQTVETSKGNVGSALVQANGSPQPQQEIVTGRVWHESEVLKLTRHEYPKYSADIDEARRTPGRYIMD